MLVKVVTTPAKGALSSKAHIHREVVSSRDNMVVNRYKAEVQVHHEVHQPVPSNHQHLLVHLQEDHQVDEQDHQHQPFNPLHL